MRILFVQFGDFREAYHRFEKGGIENYYAQKFTMNWVENKVREGNTVIVCCMNTELYEEVLPNGVRTLGMSYKNDGSKLLLDLIAKENPTHMICCSPYRPVLQWCIKNKIRTLPLLADSFNNRTWRDVYRHFRLKLLLNNAHFEWVGNHNINACLSLKNIGVKPSKIVPWDFVYEHTPNENPVKTLPAPLKDVKLIYVGNVIPEKGVGESIEIVKILKNKGYNPTLTIVGNGQLDYFKKMASDLNVSELINFLGSTEHNRIVPLMSEHDVILIPSWHAYPEGLPLTIYEGFTSRTPMVLSNHPMFIGKIEHKKTGMLANEKDSISLANAVIELISNPELYNCVSSNSLDGWINIQIPTKWHELLDRWLRNNQEDKEWIAGSTLEALEQMQSSKR